MHDFIIGGDVASFDWMSPDYKCSPDGMRTISGWTVSVLNAAFGPALYVAFAETVPAEMQDRLKTLIGHCVVERISLITPWKVVYPAEN